MSSNNPVPYVSSSGRQLYQLDAPLILSNDTTYENTDFVVSSKFVPGTVGGALYGPRGCHQITIRNCTLRTEAVNWDPMWTQGNFWGILAGIRLDSPSHFTIDGLHIENFPECGLTATSMQSSVLSKISITRCLMGASFPWVTQHNKNMRIDGMRVWNTWGPGPGILSGFGGAPSHLRPSGWTGGDGLVGYFADTTLANLDFSGELFGGLKLVRSQRVCVLNTVTNVFMIQGTQAVNSNVDGTSDGASAITVRNMLVDKRLGVGEATDRANGMQISWNVQGLDVENFSLIAGGTDGHAIQCSGNVQAGFRKGVITGWNGKRGNSPAYALEVNDGSTVNADFETVNRFYDQQRIRLG
jgi:hypothetical protein